ncbi:hypothetical protein OOT00_04740 [Desulfobotulus sp. H1]|uniref:Uncharacterized protein n=1 Tax=Desulfobotulus pelophilus TaxID=2823377 RepID=A0ABT3N759_9BACT|nr:hypothetical protein [Desulfobotulus pelophilus]MCW7753291.1 hypothetical protein [Desulfobotulus pelophilus]
MKKHYACLFLCLMGLFGFYGVIDGLSRSNDSLLLSAYESFFVKYSLILALAGWSCASILIAYLVCVEYITHDYYNASKYDQAKTSFVIMTSTMPAWIFFYITILHTTSEHKIIYVLYGLFLFIYVDSIFTLCKKKSE